MIWIALGFWVAAALIALAFIHGAGKLNDRYDRIPADAESEADEHHEALGAMLHRGKVDERNERK